MKWRPKNWKNPYPENEKYLGMARHMAFETGADAMLEALEKWENPYLIMAKVVLCPVCNGSSVIYAPGTNSPQTCHGCGGKGWVSVPEEGGGSK